MHWNAVAGNGCRQVRVTIAAVDSRTEENHDGSQSGY
jgi:hypothetical protein